MKIEILSATQTAAQHLRDMIVIGELRPGQKINETQLASEMGLSRPPLREAFRILESECLITNIPRKSKFVSNISKDDFEKIYFTRRMIECFSIDLIKMKGIKDFTPLYQSLEEASSKKLDIEDSPREILECLKSFAEFHIKLVEITRNPYLLHFYQSISSNLLRYQFLYFSKKYKKPLLDEHLQIFQLIQRGDYEQAKDYLISHINYSFEEIIREGF
ncbi:MAG: GntR family transcriptional regulator [Thermodesulfobacteriota bacterium]